MHRDEAIYARADAHAITLTPEEAERVLAWYRSAEVHWDATEKADRALAARLEAASTTSPS